MTKQKTKLELPWICKDKWPRLESRILLARLSKSRHAKHSLRMNRVCDNNLQAVALTSCHVLTIVLTNNTPPASRQISAPRGVTRFWGVENPTTRAQATIA